MIIHIWLTHAKCVENERNVDNMVKKDTMKAIEEKSKVHISMEENIKHYFERNSELHNIDEHKWKAFISD